LARIGGGDVNNDGKMDILVMDADGPPVLLLNRTDSRNHAVMFRLIGMKSNKAAVGTRVRVRTGKLTQMGEVQAGSSYLSQNDLRLHFGIGTHAIVDKVEIVWPTDKKRRFRIYREILFIPWLKEKESSSVHSSRRIRCKRSNAS